MRFIWGLAHLLQGRDRISPGAPTTYARHTPAVATPAWLMSHKNGPFYNFTTLRCMSPHNTTYAWLMAPKNDPPPFPAKRIAQVLGTDVRPNGLTPGKRPTVGCDLRDTEESVARVAAVATT